MKKFWLFGFGVSALVAVLAAYVAATTMLHYLPPALHAPVPAAPLFPKEAANIAPHRALYRIEMVQHNSSAQIVNISGKLYFEWKPVCGAWTTNHRFDVSYEYPDSPSLRIVSDFTTYEQDNGESFSFSSRRRRDGEVYEELRGHAVMPAAGTEGTADFTMPDSLHFDLPLGTLFPMAHTLAVLKAAHEGKKFFKATIFDGSDQDGPTEVTAFIGPPVDGKALSAHMPQGVDKTLLASPARHVRLAFFPLQADDPDPDYEMDMILHDNGLISDMRVDYKEFSVTQKLIGLEKVAAPACAP